MSTFVVNTELTTINCGSCGGTYAICEKYRAQKQEQSGHWTCPYCKTGWGYTEGENDKLKKTVAQLQSRIEHKDARIVELQVSEKHLIKSRQGMKGALVKTQKRVRHGVCPCCTRTFPNLAAHMATKHPDYSKKVEEV